MKISSRNINWSNVVCSALMGIGLIITIVGLFVNFAHANTRFLKLFELSGVIGGFTIALALLSFVGASALTGCTVYSAATDKEFKVLTIVLICLTLIFTIAFAIMSSVACINLTETIGSILNVQYKLSASSYLIFFGTIVAPLLAIANKMFK